MQSSFAGRARSERGGLERGGLMMQLPMEVEADLIAVLETQNSRTNSLA